MANSLSFRKTHDIAELLEMCKEKNVEFGKLYELEADRLTVYGIEVRYPDDFYFPSLPEATKCVSIAEQVRSFVLDKVSSSQSKR